MGKSKAISLRLDEKLLQDFDKFAEELGADRTTLITMFMNYCVLNCALPFTPSSKPVRYEYESEVTVLAEPPFKYRR